MQKLIKVLTLLGIFCITGVFSIYSLIATCYITKEEQIYYTYSSRTDFFLFLFVMIFLFIFYIKFKQRVTASLKLSTLLLTSFVIGSLFVLLTALPPKADQYACFTIAKQMHGNDFSAFERGNYMYVYPQQTGLVLLYYVLGFVIGTDNLVFLQLLNVVAYTGFLYAMYILTLRLFRSDQIARQTTLFSLLFLPLLFYTSFLYGTMIGLATSTFAMVKAMDYMDYEKRTDGLLCALLCGIAVLCKKNFLIVAVAILLLLGLHGITNRLKKELLCLFAIIASLFVFLRGPILIGETLSGQSLDQGMPSIAWITMGLQEGWRGNGWYNGYTLTTYQQNGCDSDKTFAIAASDLKNQYEKFLDGTIPPEPFFIQKLTSEWNEPSFECLRITDASSITKAESPFRYWLVQDLSPSILLTYFNLFQSIVYIGAFLFFLYEGRHLSFFSLLPMLVFLGGFFFHTVWEAKGQYTICYFVLLFPFCIKGYETAFAHMETCLKKNADFSVPRLLTQSLPFSLILISFFAYGILRSLLPSVQETAVTANASYQTFLNTSSIKKPLTTGNYRLQASDDSSYLTVSPPSETETLTASLQKEPSDSQIIHLSEDSDGVTLILKKYQQSLSAVSFEKIDTKESALRKNIYDFSHTISWKLRKLQNGNCILYTSSGYALTRTKKGTIVLSPFDSSSLKQQWHLLQITLN